ncbi:DUF4398 domain-containing protein [Povalibacter sp.]|uniref:DUF4398 domain-containing protein n=1 Tax=Povalibacter sp. TaxID=1962978 RepID=UPI002F424612
MSISFRSLTLVAGAAASLLTLTACGGVSELTRQEVARSETAVKQAQQSLGSSEAGAIELQQAKDYFTQAQKAVEEQNETRAQRYAKQAELSAQLATAKAQNASARKAADELLASIQTLRQETNRPATSQQ